MFTYELLGYSAIKPLSQLDECKNYFANTKLCVHATLEATLNFLNFKFDWNITFNAVLKL